MNPLHVKAPGRPYWKMPRRLVVEDNQPSIWAMLSSAAKSSLPVLEILSNGVETGAGISLLSDCIGSRTTVCRGLSDLEYHKLIERKRRHSRIAGNVSTLTQLSPSLTAANRERLALFCRAVVTGGAWASLIPAGRALYVVLVCGVHGDGFRAWTSTPEARPWATRGGLDPEDGEPRFTSLGERNPDYEPGGFDWLRFVGDVTRSSATLRKLLAALPCASLRKHDDGAIGIGTLAKFSGLSESAVRDGIESLADSRLALVIRPPISSEHRFVLPDMVRWMMAPDFLLPRVFDRQETVAGGTKDTPF